MKGCVVINIGDALEFWSGGLFRSTLHRVVMPRSQAELASRYCELAAPLGMLTLLAIAYFVHPDNNSVLDAVMDGS
jgi:isopenicillin N synthase-like dioxygenase